MGRVEGYNGALGGYRTDGGRESQTIFLNDVIKQYYICIYLHVVPPEARRPSLDPLDLHMALPRY